MKSMTRDVSPKYQPLKDRLRFSFFLLRRRKSPLVGLAIILLLVAAALLARIGPATRPARSWPKWGWPIRSGSCRAIPSN
jgi:hypothetical protein